MQTFEFLPSKMHLSIYSEGMKMLRFGGLKVNSGYQNVSERRIECYQKQFHTAKNEELKT